MAIRIPIFGDDKFSDTMKRAADSGNPIRKSFEDVAVSIAKSSKANDKLTESLKKGEKATKAQRAEFAALERAGKSVFEQTRTPIEKLRLQIETLKKIPNISNDTATRAIKELNREYLKLIESTKKSSITGKEAGNAFARGMAAAEEKAREFRKELEYDLDKKLKEGTVSSNSFARGMAAAEAKAKSLRTELERNLDEKISEADAVTKAFEKSLQKDAAAAKKLAAEVKKIHEDSRTPGERHNARVARLRMLHEKAGLSARDMNTQIRKSRDATSGFSSSVASLSKRIAGAAAAYVSLYQGIQLVIRGFREQIEIQQAASEGNIGVAGGQSRLLLNLGASASNQQRRSVIEQTRALSAKVGIQEAILGPEFGKAFSATSGSNIEERLEKASRVISEVAPFFRTQSEFLGTFAGNILDIQRSVKSESGGEISADDAFSLLLTAQEQSRIVDINNLKYLVPAIAAGYKEGQPGLENTRAAIALFTTLGPLIADETGERTGTAVAKVITQLQKYIGETDPNKNLVELIRTVQGSERLQDEMASVLQGRGVTKPQIERILRGFTAFEDNLAAIQINTAGAKELRDYITSQGDNGTEALKQLTAIREATELTSQFLRKRDAKTGSAREVLFQNEGAAYKALPFYRRFLARAGFESSLALEGTPGGTSRGDTIRTYANEPVRVARENLLEVRNSQDDEKIRLAIMQLEAAQKTQLAIEKILERSTEENPGKRLPQQAPAPAVGAP